MSLMDRKNKNPLSALRASHSHQQVLAGGDLNTARFFTLVKQAHDLVCV